MTDLNPNNSAINNRNNLLKTISEEGSNNFYSSLIDGQKDNKTELLSPEDLEANDQNKNPIWYGIQKLWWQRESLPAKVTLFAIAIGTLPVVGIGTTAYYFANQSLTKEITAAKLVNVEGLADGLSSFMSERYGDIQFLAKLPIFANSEVRKITTTSEKQEVLTTVIKSYQSYDSIVSFDLNGNPVLQSAGQSIGNQKDQPYFQEVLEKDRPVIIGPITSKTEGTSNVYFAAPIKNFQTGKTIGIVSAQMPVNVLEKRIQSYVNPSIGEEYHLIDSNGVYFVASAKEDYYQKADNEFPTYSQLKAADKPDVQIIFSQRSKEENVVAYTPLKLEAGLPDLKWQIMIQRNTKNAFAIQRQLLLTIALGTAITTLLVAAIATYIANRGTLPITAAANAVGKIGEGKLDTRLQVEGNDELALLGANINQMASQLETLVQEQSFAAQQALLLANITGSRTLNYQELNRLFNNTLDEARENLKADRLLVYRFNPTGGGEIIAESVVRGFPSIINQTINYPVIPEQLLDANQKSSVVAINDMYQTNLSIEQNKFAQNFNVKAFVEIPILQEGKPFALLIAHQCQNSRDWQLSEINFLKQLAAQLGLCVDRVILLEQTENLAQEQRQLKEDLQQRALELLMEVDPISKGDLTIRAKVTADEIGTIADSYNATVGNLRKIVLQVQQAANQVAQTTSSNEASVQSLSAEALRQAEEIAVALQRAQEMAQSVQLVAANAQEAEGAVRQAALMVQEGDAAMNRTVDGILAIRETVAETAKKVKHLGESSQKISTVVNLIGSFAAQTNLLALNASIEAARAGEEGRGFAVVADEVRSLARQSAEATSEIEKLVAAIQTETNEVVAAMEAGTEQVVMGTKLVDETRQSLNKITVVSNQINKLVEEIAMTTIIQSQSSEAVTQTMFNVAAIANRTSEEATMVSSSFEQLRKVAQVLQDEVGQFKVS